MSLLHTLPAHEPPHRPTLTDLPTTAKLAFRFHQGHKLLLYCQGQTYEGDLVAPERWHHLPAGTSLFVRLPGGLEAAPIVGAIVRANHLQALDLDACAADCVLELELNPDRPAAQAPAPGEIVRWQRGQLQTLFVYWPRLPKVVYRRDA